MVRIIVADDHYVVRQGVRALLETQPDLEVVDEVGDGQQLLRSIESSRPDVVILDLMMPALSGLEVLPQLVRLCPDARVIIFSMYANEPYVMQALQEGAVGYVLKDASPDDLVRAVREVLAGRRFLSAPLSERAIEAYVSGAGDSEDPYENLTAREREVLRLAAEGLPSTGIAERLFISPRTVQVHRTNLTRKLGLRTQTDLVRFAIKRGILSLE